MTHNRKYKGGTFMHLLVVEDERALCETIVRSLRRLAYSVDYTPIGKASPSFAP